MQEGHKKVKKFERKLLFADVQTTRDFLFHLVRCQHMWCCSKLGKGKPRMAVLDKFEVLK